MSDSATIVRIDSLFGCLVPSFGARNLAQIFHNQRKPYYRKGLHPPCRNVIPPDAAATKRFIGLVRPQQDGWVRRASNLAQFVAIRSSSKPGGTSSPSAAIGGAFDATSCAT